MPGNTYSLGSTWSRVYTLTGPDGTEAVFNNPSHPNYVGYLDPERCSGLDSPLVRSSTDDIVGFDGALANPGYLGARPIILAGQILGATVYQRDARETRLKRARLALRANARLSWAQSDGVTQYIDLRWNDRAEVTGGWVKNFQVPLIAPDPRVYSAVVHVQSSASYSYGGTGRTYPMTYTRDYGATTPGLGLVVNNAGDTPSYPIIRVYGHGVDPIIDNLTVGAAIRANITIPAGQWLTFDTLNRTLLLNDEADYYADLDFINTDWWGLASGDNDVRVRFASSVGAARAELSWRDAWV